MQDIVKEMDVLRNSAAITKIATLSYETSISSLWTTYLILYEDLLEIWGKRIELMGLYIYIDLVTSSHRILLPKVTEQYQLSGLEWL